MKKLLIQLMQQWYSLSDLGVKEALIEVLIRRCFAGLDLIGECIPDATTILTFSHLLELNEIVQKIYYFAGLRLRDFERPSQGIRHGNEAGTMIDGTMLVLPAQPSDQPEIERGRATRTRAARGIRRNIRPRKATLGIIFARIAATE